MFLYYFKFAEMLIKSEHYKMKDFLMNDIWFEPSKCKERDVVIHISEMSGHA